MNAPLPQQWMDRMVIAVKTLCAGGRKLMEAVHGEMEAFFAEHPEVERTPETEEIVVILVFQRLTGVSAPETQTPKAA
jgi:hypothetical protein